MQLPIGQMSQAVSGSRLKTGSSDSLNTGNGTVPASQEALFPSGSQPDNGMSQNIFAPELASASGLAQPNALEQQYSQTEGGVYMRLLDDADPSGRATGRAIVYEKKGDDLVATGTREISQMTPKEREEQIQFRALYNPGRTGGKAKIDYDHYNDLQRQNGLQTVKNTFGAEDGRLNLVNPQTGQKYTEDEINRKADLHKKELERQRDGGTLTKEAFETQEKQVEREAKFMRNALGFDKKDGLEEGVLDINRLKKDDQESMLHDMGLFDRLKPQGFWSKLGHIALGFTGPVGGLVNGLIQGKGFGGIMKDMAIGTGVSLATMGVGSALSGPLQAASSAAGGLGGATGTIAQAGLNFGQATAKSMVGNGIRNAVDGKNFFEGVGNSLSPQSGFSAVAGTGALNGVIDKVAENGLVEKVSQRFGADIRDFKPEPVSYAAEPFSMKTALNQSLREQIMPDSDLLNATGKIGNLFA